ncbi:hypothetical protein [Cloacibacterium sp.]|uniref:hypothetical protein n=1 Tax=Cloacibacterium sp. TaxID=1913682 RepID=UPI0039E5FAB9
MADIIFKTKDDVTDSWVQYIENESRSLAQRDEFAIQNYADREILNPAVQSYLETIDDDGDDIVGEAFAKSAGNVAMMTTELEGFQLNYAQEVQWLALPEWLRFRFRRIKKKVQKIFCAVAGELIDGGELDIKGIIKAVLLALIPAFASGLPAAVFSIIIGLVAYLLKYGYTKTCPAN